MTAPTTLRIDVADLVDAYVTISETGFGYDDPEYPPIYSLAIDGEPWLTDRFWLLPESVCELPNAVKPSALGVEVGAKATGWVRDLRTRDLTETTRRFAATFAGELTRAGLHAKGGLAGNMCALVDADGNRVGILNPIREDVSHRGLPLPVPASVVEMFERINDVGIIRCWQAWTLAAILTGEATS